MNEISNSIAEAIRKRVASATLGTYLFFWAAYHWQGIYVTLFVSQDAIMQKHALLKNEYVNTYFFGRDGLLDKEFYLGILAPLILTYIFIWWVPYLLLKAYKKEQWYKVERRIIRIDQEKRVQEDRKELAIETADAIKKETEVSKAKKKAIDVDPEILWDEEIKVMSHQENILFKETLQCIYQHRGNVMVPGEYTNYENEFELSPDALRFSDSKELVTIVDKGSRIELTTKGKYYASKFKGTL